jgi:hypothetical protein
MTTLVDTIRFAVPPVFTLHSCSTPSSEDSDTEDGFNVPFTTSPLDECRGRVSVSSSEKSPTRIRGYAASTHKKKRRSAGRPQNATVRRRY